MTRKQTKLFVYFILPVLAAITLATNSSRIFGAFSSSDSDSDTSSTDTSPPATAVEATSGDSPKPKWETVGEETLPPLGENLEEVRNPFLTLIEQNPLLAKDLLRKPTEIEEIWPPPEKTVQVILITKNIKVASIEGKRVHEGDEFFGGWILSIQPDRVTVQMSKGRLWVIPLETHLALQGRANENVMEDGSTQVLEDFFQDLAEAIGEEPR